MTDPRAPIRVVPPPSRGLPTGMRSRPGLALLPQRLFLGVTFCFAGLQKLADPSFFDASRPTSIQGQLRLFQHSSPIRAVLGPVAQHAVAFGVVIALAEVAIGLATLLGLWSHLAAAGGALLSLSFLLTVSWATRPYYYGSDIVFVVMWLPLLVVGSGGVLSLDSWRSRPSRGPAGDRGPATDHDVGIDPADARRRAVLATGVVGAAALALSGADAALGRGVRQDKLAVLRARRAAGTRSAPPATAAPGAVTGPKAGPVTGTPIGAVDGLPVGGALAFTDPASGAPAYALQPTAGRYVGFSRICTHAGCEVDFDASSRQLVCPCHGGLYDAATGAVLAGPPPAPLTRIDVRAVGGRLEVPVGG